MKMKTENPAWDAGPWEVARGRCPEDGTGWGGGSQVAGVGALTQRRAGHAGRGTTPLRPRHRELWALSQG